MTGFFGRSRVLLPGGLRAPTRGSPTLFPRVLLLLGLLAAAGFRQESPAPLDEVLELMAAGSYPAARERLSTAGGRNPHVLRLRLELAARTGDEEGVRRLAGRLLDLYDSGALRSPGEIAEAAYAAWQLEQWKRANQLYLEAARGAGAPLWLYVDWGNLYLEKHNGAEAESIFRDALKASPQDGWSRWGTGDARLGVARALKAQQMAGVDVALAHVLKENPGNLDGHVLKGLLAMEAGDWKEAQDWIGRGLDGNPNYVPLLELECVLLHFQEKQEKQERFEERLRNLLEINPRNGNLYRIMGDFAALRRRMEEAIEYYREAVRRNPGEWPALAALGINLLRMAQEEEGKRVLERAYENDPYNVSTVNTLRLVDSFDRFVRHETPRYWLRLHGKEAGALEPYVRRLLDRSISFLEEKYRHQVGHKFLVEFYPDHEDFAVRALGLPGLGAFGATFGRILAMDSPSARPKGTYHWGSTLWHEMAHVVILSLSRDRVPRWLTEGISMMEERLAGPGWGDGLSPSLVRAYERGEIAPLKDLNKGFESPRTREHLQNSYLQAGLACRYMADRHGTEKVRALVEGFSRGLDLEESFQEALGISAADFDRDFLKELDRTLKPLVDRMKPPAILRGRGKSQSRDEYLKSLLEAANRDEENYFLNLALGETLDEAGRSDEAVPFLERAIRTFPDFATAESPYSLLARIHRRSGDTTKLIPILDQWFRAAPQLAENGLELARLLAAEDQVEPAVRVLEEVLYADTLNPEVHRLLGSLYLRLGRGPEAADEYRVLLELSPLDTADAHYRLARALDLAGDTAQARRQVLLALEIAPGYRDAQTFLLELVRR